MFPIYSSSKFFQSIKVNLEFHFLYRTFSSHPNILVLSSQTRQRSGGHLEVYEGRKTIQKGRKQQQPSVQLKFSSKCFSPPLGCLFSSISSLHGLPPKSEVLQLLTLAVNTHICFLSSHLLLSLCSLGHTLG